MGKGGVFLTGKTRKGGTFNSYGQACVPDNIWSSGTGPSNSDIDRPLKTYNRL